MLSLPVVEAVDKIYKLDLISREKYKEIKLNEKGIKAAKRVIHKHIVLKRFLNMLGVDNETADREACAMEHILCESTVNKFQLFTEFIETHPKGKEFIKSFRNYEKTRGKSAIPED